MLETVDGCVKIDGDDVAKLPLSTHRARLNIIPQKVHFKLLPDLKTLIRRSH